MYSVSLLQDSRMGPSKPCCAEGPRTYKILKFVVVSFALDSILLTENSNLDSCYEIWECVTNNCRCPYPNYWSHDGVTCYLHH